MWYLIPFVGLKKRGSKKWYYNYNKGFVSKLFERKFSIKFGPIFVQKNSCKVSKSKDMWYLLPFVGLKKEGTKNTKG